MLFTTCVFGQTNEASQKVTLNFSGGKAICNTRINYTGKTIKATMKLYSGNALSGSWTGEAVGSLTLTGKRVVISGKTYTLKVTATVDGKSISASPITKTAP